jgi:hypothetical protein
MQGKQRCGGDQSGIAGRPHRAGVETWMSDLLRVAYFVAPVSPQGEAGARDIGGVSKQCVSHLIVRFGLVL